jgi:hypothetical protein
VGAPLESESGPDADPSFPPTTNPADIRAYQDAAEGGEQKRVLTAIETTATRTQLRRKRKWRRSHHAYAVDIICRD